MRTPDDLVRVEVHYCVSALVAELARGYGGTNEELGDIAEAAFELCTPIDDWEEAAIQAGWSIVDRDPEGDDASEPCLYNTSLDRIWPLGDWRGACEDSDVEPYQREVFEHWIVSDWLADELAKHGEKVDKDFYGLTVWARTTTGQGIASDAVIEALAAGLNASSHASAV